MSFFNLIDSSFLSKFRKKRVGPKLNRKVRNELYGMDDHALNDIGLTRGELDNLIRGFYVRD
jgi:hypothetical protein